ncbi:hypothetical protein [Cryobacterium sp. M91]|uniref:hypothetical protein n=1 Tax=Cryobacterium sp. M91 TaxID=2048294 RepID=UPI000CE300B0|nr:hypothetical protein [Cryobacterium sp. M91]
MTGTENYNSTKARIDQNSDQLNSTESSKKMTITFESHTAKLGATMVAAVGIDACISGYGTSTDPAEIGQAALAYGDINWDGSLN